MSKTARVDLRNLIKNSSNKTFKVKPELMTNKRKDNHVYLGSSGNTGLNNTKLETEELVEVVQDTAGDEIHHPAPLNLEDQPV